GRAMYANVLGYRVGGMPTKSRKPTGTPVLLSQISCCFPEGTGRVQQRKFGACSGKQGESCSRFPNAASVGWMSKSGLRALLHPRMAALRRATRWQIAGSRPERSAHGNPIALNAAQQAQGCPPRLAGRQTRLKVKNPSRLPLRAPKLLIGPGTFDGRPALFGKRGGAECHGSTFTSATAMRNTNTTCWPKTMRALTCLILKKREN